MPVAVGPAAPDRTGEIASNANGPYQTRLNW
jgi:hypothetical protein